MLTFGSSTPYIVKYRVSTKVRPLLFVQKVLELDRKYWLIPCLVPHDGTSVLGWLKMYIFLNCEVHTRVSEILTTSEFHSAH